METKIQIIKFGGTSVGTGERIRRVANIIAHKVHDAGEDFPVVVVSAMAGVTDQLLRIARLACSGENQDCETELHALIQIHLEAAKNLLLKHEDRYNELIHDLEAAFATLKQDVTELQSSATTPHVHEVSLRTAAIAAWASASPCYSWLPRFAIAEWRQSRYVKKRLSLHTHRRKPTNLLAP